MHIRVERDGDAAAVRQVNQQAFGASVEADLVDALREQAKPFLSLVAEDDGAIVGHIAFSPVTLASAARLRVMGLAPMAVLPDRQRRGTGSALVRAGLDECRRLGASAVVVLGHPEYYPRFGFRPAPRFDLRSEYDVPDDVFMALELVQGALTGQSGTVRYHQAFAGLG